MSTNSFQEKYLPRIAQNPGKRGSFLTVPFAKCPGTRVFLAYQLIASVDVSAVVYCTFELAEDEFGLDPAVDSTVGSSPGRQMCQAAAPVGEVAEEALDRGSLFE